jgi:uncharacterized membrane protein required for colicin V production
MALYDIVMLVVVVGAIWFGWWKGMAWQIASLAAIIVSYIVAVNFREPVSRYISADEPWNRIAAMLILFLGTSLLIWTIYASVSKSLKKMELKGFDHQAGALLGAVKGALLCMIITMFSVSLLGEKAHDAIHNSRSGRYVVSGITKVSAIVPGELAKFIQPHVDDFHNAIGHDGQLPIDQYPENPAFNFNLNQQSAQDPNLVPSYQGQTQPGQTYPGQWQTPSYSNQSNPQDGNSGINISWPQNRQANSSGSQPNGSQFNGGYPANTASPNNGINNGFPDVNFQVNTQELLDAGKEAAFDAARRAFESNQNR